MAPMRPVGEMLYGISLETVPLHGQRKIADP
jgi:hypothetical protein